MGFKALLAIISTSFVVTTANANADLFASRFETESSYGAYNNLGMDLTFLYLAFSVQCDQDSNKAGEYSACRDNFSGTHMLSNKGLTEFKKVLTQLESDRSLNSSRCVVDYNESANKVCFRTETNLICMNVNTVFLNDAGENNMSYEMYGIQLDNFDYQQENNIALEKWIQLHISGNKLKRVTYNLSTYKKFVDTMKCPNGVLDITAVGEPCNTVNRWEYVSTPYNTSASGHVDDHDLLCD